MCFKGNGIKTIVLALGGWLALSFLASACGNSDAATLIPTAGTSAAGMAQVGTAGKGGGSVIVTAGGSAITAAGGAKAVETGTAGTAPATGGTKAIAGASGKAPTADAGAGAGAKADAGEGGKAAPTAGKGGAAGAAGTVNPRTIHHAEDLGEGDGQDVICIGDSWMSIMTNGDGIQGAMNRVSGQNYRHYGLAATTVLSGQIPGQYTNAKRANPDIKTVIMTGGGNDIIMDATMSIACAATSGDLSTNACRRRLLDVANRLGELWTEMSNDGVRDLFNINYAKGAATSVTEYIQADIQVEYQKIIAALPPPIVVHYIQTEEIVNGSGVARLIDGIHPTRDACTDIAQATYDHMKEAGARR